MAILKDQDKQAIRERFGEMTGDVKMIYFTQEIDCQYCADTQALLTEVAELSDKLTLEVHNKVTDGELAESYGVDKAPATVLTAADGKDHGIRYYGIPSGYEFASLLEDILMLSANDSGLDQATRDALANLSGDVHMQVFVTPTCPYCPGAVRVAHQMAFESEKVKADMVEATEFPDLSMRYNVQGVPRTVINDDFSLEGMMPEQAVLQEVLKAV
ncbi:thioredoxin family protein [bacterium]|nr:thioredoxin family protein [bacterium]